jgi:putative colanic acid biosynthesis acetyltransferase WcaF
MDQYIIEKYVDKIPVKEKVLQQLWLMTSLFTFKLFSSNLFNRWRILQLKLWGAKIGKGCIVYSNVYIPAPWNLHMGQYSCLGPNVKLHILETVIGSKVTISQGSYLCTGSHDISKINKPFIGKKIVIEDFAWVAAEVFVGPGVTIGQGAVVGARSAVFKDVDSWTVVGGNPAQFIKKRNIEK